MSCGWQEDPEALLSRGSVWGWKGFLDAFAEEGPADSQVTSSRKEGQSSGQLKMKASASYGCFATCL